MKLSSKFLFECVVLVIICALSSSGREISPRDDEGGLELFNSEHNNYRRPGGRSLLSSPPRKQEIELTAAPNGTVYLLESNSRKVLWSFSSGPPIYSSYHAPIYQADGNNKSVVYVDFGEDWELYLNDRHGNVRFNQTIQAYVERMPEISKNRGITLGSIHTTVFEINPWTGEVIKKYGHSGFANVSDGSVQNFSSEEETKETENSGLSQEKSPDVEFYIKRIDYKLHSYSSDSHELWNLTAAFFDAELLCKQNGDLMSQASSHSGDNFVSSSDARILMSCLLKFDVHRFSSQAMFESFLTLNGPPQQTPTDKVPSLQTARNTPAQSSNDNEFSKNSHADMHGRRSGRVFILATLSNDMWKLSQILYILCILLAIVFVAYVVSLAVHAVDAKRAQTVISRKKKTHKSGKLNTSVEEGLLSDNCDNPWMNLNGVGSGADGHVIGRLYVSTKQIAKGSNGTVIFEGLFQGRKVAVKRLVKAQNEEAYKEVQNLIASEKHPNIVWWLGVEHDKDFVYLALERCICSMDDLIQLYANPNRHHQVLGGEAFGTPWNVDLRGIKLWKSNGYPSPMLLKLMRDMAAGLAHLHGLGIVHRDIKPQNVLITNERSLCAQLSDMGISKRLPPDMSSFGHQVTGCGSSGWRAPEMICHGRQTKSVDMFSLGCVFFYCITGGGHPFGEHHERDFNIINEQINLQLVDHIPEAMNMFKCLLVTDPRKRLTASEVLHHPLFWDSERRLSFLRDVSDRVELEDRDQNGSMVLQALENTAHLSLGLHWDRKLEPAFINNIGRYRRYRYDSVRDLLRVIRNKFHHYRELPQEIQELLGPIPEGYDNYFTTRFPKLLIEVYSVVYSYCKTEECFQKYFGGDSIGILL